MEPLTRSAAYAWVAQLLTVIDNATPYLPAWDKPDWADALLVRAKAALIENVDYDADEWFTFDEQTQERYRDGPDWGAMVFSGSEQVSAARDAAGPSRTPPAPPESETDEERRTRQRRIITEQQVAAEHAMTLANALLHPLEQAVLDRRALHMQQLEQAAATERQLRDEELRARPAPAPAAQEYGVSHDGAERLVAAWMRHLGVLDAEVTSFSKDGGIDVTSATHLVQVKNYAGSVGVQAIRELHGVATAEQKTAAVFTSGTVTATGVEFADRVGIALVRYRAEEGRIHGLNLLGAHLANHGVRREPTN